MVIREKNMKQHESYTRVTKDFSSNQEVFSFTLRVFLFSPQEFERTSKGFLSMCIRLSGCPQAFPNTSKPSTLASQPFLCTCQGLMNTLREIR